MCAIVTSFQVLSWLKRSVPQHEQATLRHQVAQSISDTLLQQLLDSWLIPSRAANEGGGPLAIAVGDSQAAAPPAQAAHAHRQEGQQEQASLASSPPGGAAAQACFAMGQHEAPGAAAEPPRCLSPSPSPRDGAGAAACEPFVCCGGRWEARGCTRSSMDIEEALAAVGSKPPLRVSMQSMSVRTSRHARAGACLRCSSEKPRGHDAIGRASPPC
jgi:hypothetical protein